MAPSLTAHGPEPRDQLFKLLAPKHNNHDPRKTKYSTLFLPYAKFLLLGEEKPSTSSCLIFGV